MLGNELDDHNALTHPINYFNLKYFKSLKHTLGKDKFKMNFLNKLTVPVNSSLEVPAPSWILRVDLNAKCVSELKSVT